MIERHINLGTCPQLNGDWRALRGISGSGFYFALCKWVNEHGEEIRIFWYRHDQRFERWFRTPPYRSRHNAEMWMNDIEFSIHRNGHANNFIEEVSSWRRREIQAKRNDRLERRAEFRARQSMLKLPTYGLF